MLACAEENYTAAREQVVARCALGGNAHLRQTEEEERKFITTEKSIAENAKGREESPYEIC